MANTIIIKRSSEVGKVPTSGQLQVGEIAVNLADRKLYSKTAGNTVVLIGSGAVQDASITTTSVSQTALVSFPTTSYGSGEFLIQATQGTSRHSTKILVAHNSTTAIATEYGELITNSELFSVEVDINSGNVRVLVTPTSATSTVFNTVYTLVAA